MPALRHRKSGVVIHVPDERVRLFPAYEVVDGPAPAPAVEDEPAPVVEQAEPEAPSAVEGYEDLTVVELKAEIRNRNKGRDEADRLPLTGDKAELIASLEADDNK